MAELAAPKPVESRKRSAKAAILALAKQRFAEQQSASSHHLVAPISPSPPQLIDATIDQLRTRGLLTKRLVDLGCGDCRWLVAARPYCRRLVGYDIDGTLLAKGRVALDAVGTDHLLVEADFFEAPDIFEEGDVVVAYLFREGCAKLRAKLEKELRRGTLVCVGFELRGWRSSFEVAAGGLVARVYEVGAEAPPV
jgi:SAM-dependent methyltransferase